MSDLVKNHGGDMIAISEGWFRQRSSITIQRNSSYESCTQTITTAASTNTIIIYATTTTITNTIITYATTTIITNTITSLLCVLVLS